MNKIKIGVFGGARGSVMIHQLLHHPQAELVAVCDRYEPLLEQVRRDAEGSGCAVALYTNFEDFIKHDMDAVVLANYATEHATFAIRCLRAGKHVMSEVLPSETVAQAVELVETVEQTGLVYAYAENYCYMKAPFEMWRRYRRGDIGEVQYAEGEYIHDCSSIWTDITYGERGHWRNCVYATFYCTHSLGPILAATGLRPVRVVGFETPINDSEKNLAVGYVRNAGIEMVVLENGAVVRSVHGGLKREPGSVNYQIFGKNGMMESARFGGAEFNLYREGDTLCRGDWEHYDPENEIGGEAAKAVKGHGGSDFYPTHFFIQKILGNEEGKWSIDVYQAVDMGLCGIMAFRSILQGSMPMEIPNLRLPEVRERYRNDRACTSPEVAGDQLLPLSACPRPEVPDSVYEEQRRIWLAKQGK